MWLIPPRKLVICFAIRKGSCTNSQWGNLPSTKLRARLKESPQIHFTSLPNGPRSGIERTKRLSRNECLRLQTHLRKAALLKSLPSKYGPSRTWSSFFQNKERSTKDQGTPSGSSWFFQMIGYVLLST